MTKKQGTFGIVFLIPILLLVIGGIVFWGIKQSQPAKQSTTSTPQASPITIVSSSPRDNGLKTFKSSDVMDFTIDVPVDATVSEKFTTATINVSNGKISIGYNGTNFDNLDDYLKSLMELNKFEIRDKTSLKINELQAVRGFIDSQKTYFIYVNNRVYTVSTTVEQLYSDLDQIAKSFRYTP